MENSKESGAGEKPADPNPNPSSNPSAENSDESGAVSAAAEVAAPTRRPFTALSQVDADLALARVLQEQERAYMMLRMGGDGSEYSSEGGSYGEYEEEEFDEGEEDEEIDHDHLAEEEGEEMDDSYYDEDAFDANNQEVDAGEFEDDETFARALQDAEEREVAVRLMALAGLSEWRAVEPDDHANNSQDAWQEVDPEEYSYEELVALGEVVGTESRGASADTIASLPSVNYKSQNVEAENAEQCVVCRVEFEEDESLSILPCKHMYHPECISKWLQINKACPMCSTEVSTSGDSRKDDVHKD
ncbi:RING/U-box superfamily protein [Rhynchospora pubera]|uniref:RING/U-box superfamily protein n=1 Tax=Rhynchospora pubera TaxID=906938 RepID=A0AAV8E965_9POAL|nr:RING/U-box superfamily protein [Rhynchospora pubera]